MRQIDQWERMKMKEETKLSASKRQKLIVDMLKEENRPITGTEFAQLANVSRQVIVQDVAILKAKDVPIVATGQGYILLNQEAEEKKFRLVIVCDHSPNETRDELYTIVDHGVTVKDVIIEHAVYGDLTASIMVSTRVEVDQFIRKINETNASYLSSLTGGIHLHTLEADSMDKIKAACQELKNAGILVE
jgi:uncharacterized protein